MKKGCQHPNMIMIEDENHDEHLPVKKVLICADCNDEIPNESLLMHNIETIAKTYEENPERKKWERKNSHENQLELIKKEPLYKRKTKP